MSRRLYLLDTDVCIDLLRVSVDRIPSSMRKLRQENLIVSSIVKAELETGVNKSARPDFHRDRLSFLMSHVTVSAFDDNAARHYGEIRADLEKKGDSIGPLDLLIAAHARSLSAILVTRNLREFNRVPKLKCQAWVE